jgi:hypothetical protein
MLFREIPLRDYFSSTLLGPNEHLTEVALNDRISRIKSETLSFNAQWALKVNCNVGGKQELLQDFLEPELRHLLSIRDQIEVRLDEYQDPPTTMKRLRDRIEDIDQVHTT